MQLKKTSKRTRLEGVSCEREREVLQRKPGWMPPVDHHPCEEPVEITSQRIQSLRPLGKAHTRWTSCTIAPKHQYPTVKAPPFSTFPCFQAYFRCEGPGLKQSLVGSQWRENGEKANLNQQGRAWETGLYSPHTVSYGLSFLRHSASVEMWRQREIF